MAFLIKCLLVPPLIPLIFGQEVQQESGRVFPEGRIIETPLLPCEERCEVRFPDRKCRLNITCLIAPSEAFGARVPLASSSAISGNDVLNTSVCRGRCVFEDAKGFCRLDLLCLLQRDMEGTRLFLEEFYEESIVEALLLSVESGSSTSDDEETRTKEEVQHQEGQESNPPTEDGEVGVLNIADAPPKPCPRRCEIRVAGECVLDFNCAGEL